MALELVFCAVEDFPFIISMSLEVIGDRRPLSVEIFPNQKIFGALIKFIILEDAEFYDHFDVGPSLFKFFPFGGIQGGEAIGDLFRDVLRELAHSPVHLKGAARDVEWDIWTVDSASQDH